MAIIKGTDSTKVWTSRISDFDIQREIEQQRKYLANQGKMLVDFKIGEIRKSPSGDEECYIILIWEADDQNPKYREYATAKKNSGCYIATCVYGSYDCPQVWTLRRYRDYTLAQSWYGRLFIECYYAISPKLVKIFGHTTWFKNFWGKRLDKKISKLNSIGVENTPYDDPNY